MRRRTVFAAAGFLAILALAAANSKEKESIGKLRSEIIRAFAGQSANAIAMLWAEDGELVRPSGEKAGGRDQVESIFADTLRGADAASRLKVSIEEIRFPEEGVAEVDCTYKLVGVRGVDANERYLHRRSRQEGRQVVHHQGESEIAAHQRRVS